MLSKDNILAFLLEQDTLWENETRHEAMLLYKNLYEKSPQSREALIDYVIKGPPTENVEEDLRERLQYDVFELLKYLEQSGLELTDSGKKRLKEIQVRHPEWKLSSDADISAPIYVGTHNNLFTVEEIHYRKPSEVVEMLKTFEGSWERSRWDLCSTIGKTCQRDSEWALELFSCMRNVIKELPADTMSPIFLGLQLSDGSDRTSWDKERAHDLLILLEFMLSERPEAEIWTGLPTLIKNWLKILKIEAEVWDKLTKKLAEIFTIFDFERSDKKGPVGWFQRSANHPYGDLMELYLEHAYQLIIDQKEKGIEFKLDDKTIDFFEYTTKHYALGSRYGVCILGNRLGWLEAVIPDWTEKNLYPLFYWDDNEERAEVSWSGYLWNRTLSRYLSERFRDTYLKAAHHYKEFADEEREGLIVHIAGLVWFKHIEMSDLKEFVTTVEGKDRRELLWTWENHLEKSQKEVAEDFWRGVIIPYWDWCQNRYLRLPDGNEERFSFWRLVPFSHDLFPQAAQRAINLAPSAIEDPHLFPERLVASGLSKSYPEEFTNFLIDFIKADQHPYWHDDDWQKLLEAVKDSGAKNLSNLKDELARKKMEITKP